MAKEAIPMPELADISQKLQDYLFQVAILLNVNFGLSSGDAQEESNDTYTLQALRKEIEVLKNDIDNLYKMVLSR